MCWIVKAPQNHLLSPQVSTAQVSSGLASAPKTGFSTSDASDRRKPVSLLEEEFETEEGATQQHYFWPQSFPTN